MTTLDSKLPIPPEFKDKISRGGSSGKGHGGAIDYAVPVGTEVYARYTGKVIYAGTHVASDPTKVGSYGNLVILEHEVKCSDGTSKYFYTYYAHLSEITVGLGSTIPAGDIVGLSGGAKGAPGAGTSDGPHLHYEVKYNTTGDKLGPFGGSTQNAGSGPSYCEPPKKPLLNPTSQSAPNPPRRDPLALDLDGNGIQTIGIQDGVRFDHDANGFWERTGWIGGGDGFLVWDRDGNGLIDNGRELFGDQTRLKNGSLAANGFQALAEYDDNRDGKIDAQDAVWSQLGVWVDQGYEGIGPDGDSASFFGGSEFQTLDQVGIVAINLGSIVVNLPDGQGNTTTRSGSFVWADGSTGQIAELALQRDTADTTHDHIEVPAAVAALPEAEGYGNVYDLHQAMARDASGQFQALVQSFVAETNPTVRATLLEQILFKWTGADKVSATGRGPYMDARRIAVLEAFYGRPFGNPDSAQAVQREGIYRNFAEGYYAVLMSQSHLQDLYALTDFDTDPITQTVTATLTQATAQLQAEFSADPAAATARLSEFARTLRGFGLQNDTNYLAFRETFIDQDPSLGWVIDSGGLPQYTPTNYYGHRIGTNQTEAMQTSLTQGDGVLNGYSGNDVMYGTDRLTGPYGGEWFFQELGDATIVGAGGPDIIWAGEGNDLLDGGTGNDTLAGEAGSDTYIFRRGSGQDVIQESTGYGAAGALTDIDTIWLGSNLTPQDIAVRRVGNNLMLAIINTPDTLTVKDYFSSPLNRIERIQFQDGTAWTETDWLARLNLPTAGDDVFFGGAVGTLVDDCQRRRVTDTPRIDISRDPGVAFAQVA